MKKTIMMFFALLLLAGCSAEKYTPVIKADFRLSAVYKTGDFSYSCEIAKSGDTVSVTPISTSAKGLVISCDGKNVSFKRKGFEKTFPIKEIDKTNPSIILYQVFTSLDSAQVHLIDNSFTYSGNCSVGKYTFIQKKDSSFDKISIPGADIEIQFGGFI